MFFVPQNGLLLLLSSQKMENGTVQKNPKGGRPKLAESEKRDKAIQVRLKPQSYAYVQELAQQKNTSMADVIRTLCNGDVVVMTAEQEALLRQIATMSNNLNQLARKANTEGFKVVGLLVQQRAEELGKLLDHFSK